MPVAAHSCRTAFCAGAGAGVCGKAPIAKSAIAISAAGKGGVVLGIRPGPASALAFANEPAKSPAMIPVCAAAGDGSVPREAVVTVERVAVRVMRSLEFGRLTTT